MNKEKTIEEENIKKRGKIRINAYTVWSFIFALISIAFIGIVLQLNILSSPMHAGVIGVVALAAGVILFFSFRSKSHALRIALVVLSLMVTVAYGFGSYYIYNTMSFIENITKPDPEITTYFVVVKDDSEYEDIMDIEGEKVLTLRGSANHSTDAKHELDCKVNVEYEHSDNIAEVCRSVIDNNRIILIAEGHHENLKGVISGYEENTRILYTVKIKTEKKDLSKKVDITGKPFNLYITGIDTRGPVGTVSRSDVNLILSVDPEKKSVLMTSIPRDSYVPLQGEGHKGMMDKITHTGIYGIEETLLTAEAMLGIDINYYLKVNFTTVEEVVDILGGIDIDSEQSFDSGSYYYEKGHNHLDGKQALDFARERYSFTDGDFQRNRNQQIIAEGIIRKITTSKDILEKYTAILASVEPYLETNLGADEIKALVKMQISDMKKWEISHQAVNGGTGTSPCYSLGNVNASVVYPGKGSVKSVGRKINIFTGKEIETETEKTE